MLRGAAALSRKERVDRALAGQDVDRPPFSLWHHFGLKTAQDTPPARSSSTAPTAPISSKS